MIRENERETAVNQVAEHYKSLHRQWNLKPKERKRLIELLLCGYSADDLCLAIDGLHLDSWHSGKNEDNKKWLAFSYAFREDPMDGYIEAAKLNKSMGESRRAAAREEKRKIQEQETAALEYKKSRINGESSVIKLRRQIAELGTN